MRDRTSFSIVRDWSGHSKNSAWIWLQKFLQKFLQRVDREARPLKLNLLKRAKLANTFKWRLLEKGVEQQLADELTRALVLDRQRQALSRLCWKDGEHRARIETDAAGFEAQRIASDPQRRVDACAVPDEIARRCVENRQLAAACY